MPDTLNPQDYAPHQRTRARLAYIAAERKRNAPPQYRLYVRPGDAAYSQPSYANPGGDTGSSGWASINRAFHAALVGDGDFATRHGVAPLIYSVRRVLS